MHRSSEKDEEYIHIFDGGIADNLAIEPLLRLAASTVFRQEKRIPLVLPTIEPRVPQAPCLLIIVDAYPQGVADEKRTVSDPRDVLDHFVDFNFMQAFDHFLSRRRDDFLRMAGLDRRHEKFVPGISLPGLGYRNPPLRSISSAIEFPAVLPNITRGTYSDLITVLPGNVSVSEGSVQCTLWHLALDNIASYEQVMPPIDDQDDNSSPAEPGEKNGKDVPQRAEPDEAWLRRTGKNLVYQGFLREFVGQIKTDFKLTGPARCSPAFLQQSLFAAARIAVLGEVSSRSRVCNWLKRNGRIVSDRCAATVAPAMDRQFLKSIRPVSKRISDEIYKNWYEAEGVGDGYALTGALMCVEADVVLRE